MKRYSLFCNMCGKEIKMDHRIAKEGVLSVEQNWGYFSEKDGECHSFDLCEACYDRLRQQFRLPVTVKKIKEFL